MGNSHGPRVPLGAVDRNVGTILKRHKYTEIRQIGEGSFGKAILVKNKSGSKRVCKLMDGFEMDEQSIKDTKQEIKLLSALNHSHIVRYRDHFVESGCVCIIMDYCESGDLRGVINQAKMNRQPINEKQVLKWMKQALDALTYIHSKHVLHRDLKPDNIFVSARNNLKLGDFGVAKVLSCTNDCAKTKCGTPSYLSPEACDSKPYEWSSDIWAMGCILYELCMLKVAFEGFDLGAIAHKICKSPLPSISGAYSGFVRSLYTEMLSRNPATRPSAESAASRIKRSQKESKKTGSKFKSSFQSLLKKKKAPQKKKNKDDFRPVLLGALTPIMESDGDQSDQTPKQKDEVLRIAACQGGGRDPKARVRNRFCGALVTPLPKRKVEGPRFAACPKGQVGRGPKAPVDRGAHGRGVQGRLPAGTKCRYLAGGRGWVDGIFLSYNECNGRCTLQLFHQGGRYTHEGANIEKVSPTKTHPWPRGTFVTYHSRNDTKQRLAVIDYCKGGSYNLDIKRGADFDQIRLRA